MTFTLDALVNSIAGILKAGYPSMPVYTSANQQGTRYPCFFVFEMPSYIHPEMNDRNRREIALDIVYVQQRNIPNARADVRGVIDYLDENTETFTYTDPENASCVMRCFARSYSYEDQELHYKVTVKALVGRTRADVPMMTMEEENAEIKKYSGTENQNG